MASPTNIRLGWKDLHETNTLAYHENLYITAPKSFIVQAPEHFHVFFLTEMIIKKKRGHTKVTFSSFVTTKPEAVFLVMCDPSMNEL
jgi:hypothetical protein